MSREAFEVFKRRVHAVVMLEGEFRKAPDQDRPIHRNNMDPLLLRIKLNSHSDYCLYNPHTCRLVRGYPELLP